MHVFSIYVRVDPHRFISRHSSIDNPASTFGATLWDKNQKTESQADSNLIESSTAVASSSFIRDLREVCLLEDVSGDSISHVSWMPGEGNDKVMVLAENRLNLCDLGEIGEGNKAKIVATGEQDQPNQPTAVLEAQYFVSCVFYY